MADNLEVIKAMVSAAKSDATLTGRVSNRVYFGRAADETMPYVILYAITPDGPNRCFASDCDFEEVLMQWSAFDLGPGVAEVEQIKSDLDLLFDRKTLSLDTKTFISCERSGGFGPEWDGTAWNRTVDYRVRYQ